MSSSHPHDSNPPVDNESDDSEPEYLDEDDVAEVLEDGDDVAMNSDDDMDMDGQEEHEEILLQNDSIAYFDIHKDSVFAVAQHPLHPHIVATGGSEGDDDAAPGKGYVIDTSSAESRRPLLPASYSSDPSAAAAAAARTTELRPLFPIDGHTDSVNSLAFSLPKGDFLVSGGMDGRLRVYAIAIPAAGSARQPQFKFIGESQEVVEINWVAPCPSPAFPNRVAFGASDGSVWVVAIDASDRANPIQILQTYFLHTAACTAGAWTADGLLLATVSEDASLHVFDVFGSAAAKSLVTDNGQTVVSLTEQDQRFAVEGGLYSVAVAPSGTFLAVGGAGGAIRIVGLPRLSPSSSTQQPQQQQTRTKQRGGAAARRGAAAPAAAEPSNQAGAILASLNIQSGGIESLAFAPAPQTLLAAGSVDGSIAVFDTARSFAVRKHLKAAHDGESVVKVEFVRHPPQPAMAGWLLTTCGLDGAIRRWDLRGATANSASATAAQTSAATGLVGEWKGHRGGGQGGGILGFVQGETGERIVTAGDDALVLVFEA
ncbi:WD40-repeat-containing domain protein [Bombardia bombarda]|uniref:WD40-repeat-containing domain protein n=1 Tax=Bombardia bombarda TaxID=252184 RepID=A0AA39U507_9PEZI|nr:WD40-repeat-containing domain protein [Bombardia bombarda]